MFAVAKLVVREKMLPVVPSAGIKKDETGARVYVIADKRIAERLVQLGAEKDGVTAVIAGVKPGETVVSQLTPDVRDGATVQ